MPVSRDLAVDLARNVADLFANAENRLAEALARQVRQDIADEHADRLAGLAKVRAAAQATLSRLEGRSHDAAQRAVLAAFARGARAGVDDLVRLGGDRGRDWAARRSRVIAAASRLLGITRRRDMRLQEELAELRGALPGIDAIMALVQELTQRLSSTHLRVLRWEQDAYRQVMAAPALDVLAGLKTRLRATQVAMDELAAQGVTGFTDKAGRNWSLGAYAEMATRTTVAHAAVEGAIAQFRAVGVALVIVSNAPQECKLCLIPGTVVEGPAPTGRTRSEYTGDIVRIVTASGNDLTGTPDHPVLTSRGWVALKDLAPGDQVVSHDREQGYPGVVPDDVQVPALIEEAGKARLPVLLAGPTRRDLDQDITYRKIRYVGPDRDLSDEVDSALGEPVADHLLIDRVGLGGSLLGLDDGDLGGLGAGNTSVGLMHGVEHPGALLGGGVLPALEETCGCESGSLLMGETVHVGDDAVMPGTGLDSSSAKVVTDDASADAEGGPEFLGALARDVAGDELGRLLVGELAGSGAAADGIDAARGQDCFSPGVADVEGGHELLERLAGTVALDEVVDVSISHYSGHVWDLSTEPRWYVANGIVTHNCRPFEGKVLAITGGAGPRAVEHGIEDRMVTVDVEATLGEAINKGLFHPSCRHSLSPFIPGVTRIPTNTEDPQGDADRQELRRLERETRKAKRRAAAALTPEARQKWERRVRQRQAQIRDHVDETGLHRQRHREQLGHDSPEDPPPPVQGPLRPLPRPTPPRPEPPAPPAPVQPTLPDPVDLGDLTARTDDDLFAPFSEHSDRPDVLSTILAELERRDNEPDPVDPLADVNLRGIGTSWLDYYEREHADRPDVLERITAERERRAAELADRSRRDDAAVERRLQRAVGDGPLLTSAEDLTPEQQRVEELVDEGKSWQAAYAEVYDVDDIDRQARNAEVDANRQSGERREDTIRRLYREYVHVSYLAAEDHTRGHMLSGEGRLNGIDPKSLFSGPAARARKYASGDLLEWFQANGRRTYTQFRAEILGQAQPDRGPGI